VRVIAPGKLLLTGAYAVLEGAPAIVAAVDRYAVSDPSRTDERPSAEVRAALGDEPAPHADVGALRDETGRKLGLGSSAAGLVASLGARALARGEDPRSPLVRAQIFRAARSAHARVQGGGSGVDVAASVHGGLLRYSIDNEGHATVRALRVPSDMSIAVYDSGTSSRTSDLRARLDAVRGRPEVELLLRRLRDLATRASAALEASDVGAFTDLARAFGDSLAAMGRACGAPIVLPAFAELASVARSVDAAFLPSGAGGGDVGVWIGRSHPTEAFAARARTLSMRPLAVGIDRGGLRPESLS
jgi:phosphomevalonate kinase